MNLDPISEKGMGFVLFVVLGGQGIHGFTIARIVAAVLLFVALGGHPYGYYKLLRFVVCGVNVYGVYSAAKMKKNGWAWAFGVIAILFNPVIPVYLRRGTWQFIDMGVAVVLLISVFMLRKSHKSLLDTDKRGTKVADREGRKEDGLIKGGGLMKEIFQKRTFWIILLILLLAVFVYPPFTYRYKSRIDRGWDWIFSSDGVVDLKMLFVEVIVAFLLTVGIYLIPFR
jgi:hypothetical protein